MTTFTLIVAIIYSTGGWGNNQTTFHMERGYKDKAACEMTAKQYQGFTGMGGARTNITVQWKCIEQ